MLVLLLLAAAVLALFAFPRYRADETALKALDSDRVAVAETDFGWFFDGPAEDAALIFYPGASVEETTVGLTLLKSGIFPDRDADKGEHA